MLAEPSFQPREARERVVQRVFEGCSAPALFLAKNAALSSYATGRQTSLVVDMGYEGTVGAPPALLPLHFLARTCDNQSALPVHLAYNHTVHTEYLVNVRISSTHAATHNTQNDTCNHALPSNQQLLYRELQLLYLGLQLAALVCRDGAGNHLHLPERASAAKRACDTLKKVGTAGGRAPGE